MRLAGVVLSIIGLVGIIFGVIWVTAVFPRYQKIPSDFSRTDEFEGTYTVMDPFVQQVQQSQAVQQIRGSASTLALLANPDASSSSPTRRPFNS